MKVFVKNKEEPETLIQTIIIYSHDIGMEFGIEKVKPGNYEKLEKSYNGRNRTTKSGQYQNARRKGNLHVSGNIRSGHHQR